MRMLLDIVRQSLSTLWAHKLRSFLTMFGIAWGVGSLLLLVGLGEGFRSGQERQLKTLGQNIMFMFPGRISAVEGSTQSGQTYYFTYKDYLAIRSESQFVGAAPPADRFSALPPTIARFAPSPSSPGAGSTARTLPTGAASRSWDGSC
jgi:putative ABC transport system permease protein